MVFSFKYEYHNKENGLVFKYEYHNKENGSMCPEFDSWNSLFLSCTPAKEPLDGVSNQYTSEASKESTKAVIFRRHFNGV